VLAGLYPIDSEFFTMDAAGVFLGPQYGTPADLAQTRGPSIFNNSAFGLRVRWNIDQEPSTPWAPCSTASPTIRRARRARRSASPRATAASPSASSAGCRKQDNDKFKGHAKAAIGLWGYSAKVNDQRDLDAVGNPVQRRQQGGYVLGERTLMRLGGQDDRFLTGFARYTWGDGDSTAVTSSLNLGVHLKGPFASRPDDIVGVAWTRAGMSQKWRDVQTVPADTKSGENALEISYRYAVTPWFAIQPNYQYLRNPGGGSAPNAKLIGVRLDLAL
jgi:porin